MVLNGDFANTIIFKVLPCKTNREQRILSLPASFNDFEKVLVKYSTEQIFDCKALSIACYHERHWLAC